MSAKILQPLLAYATDHLRGDALEALASAARLSPEVLAELSTWLSGAQIAAIFQAARSRMTSDEQFLEACAYGMGSYGPLLWVLRATSPRRVYELMARTTHLVSRVSKYFVVESSRARTTLRYETDIEDTRLMCLSRQAQLRSLPGIWKLPNASLVEQKCLSRGDACCVYELRWYEPNSMLPATVGVAIGALFAWVAGQFTFLRGLEFLTLPLLGAAFGLLYETRRTGRANLAYGEETHRALEGLGAEYAKATTGLLDLYYRQQEWNHVVEERSVERQRALDATLERVQRLAESRNTTLLSLSHDMRSPLAVVKANNGMLREFISGEPDALEAVEDNQQAIEKVETILREILTLSKNDGGLFDVRPERIEIGPLLETIRGILQALVIRRDIRVSVFASRHCPQSFETDPFLLGRVIDNILTNAAKYTDRGSIVVEVDGAPRGLCFKVSDSGRGIARDKLESVFTAQAADPSPYVGDSHGLGLPIVIRLLDQLGGKLEVVSKLEVGTTFWVYLPLTAPRSGHQMPELGDGPESLEDIRERVVVIRRSGGDPVR